MRKPEIQGMGHHFFGYSVLTPAERIALAMELFLDSI
jgi:hypothetical protein